jgi:exodeoxyribonuclease-1
MTASFFFYDLETSGFSPSEHRIMQFAGQRTDLELNPIGEPVNLLVKLTSDILPDIDAVLVTGITPQMTMADGLTEAEFLRGFQDNVATPGTIFLGFNTIRFDDEFIRNLHYRNFYDPYEWQWQDGRGKWDLLDVVRMTRALRPDGIEWPFDIHGKETNRLELLTSLNKLSHEHAHDALSDVEATIAVARLIRNKQTKLFEYMFTMREKNRLAELVESDEPFVYTSGRYPAEFHKATVAVRICAHPKHTGSSFVYDLRHDPAQYANMTAEQLADKWRWKPDSDEPRLPVKKLQYNHCPAVAPLSVLLAPGSAGYERLQLDPNVIKKHLAAIRKMTDLAERLCAADQLLEKKRQTSLLSTDKEVDSSIYDGFFGPADKQAMRVVRAADPTELGDLGLKFADHRLEALLPLYKARNYPKQLTSEEREEWEKFRTRKLFAGGQQSKLVKYFSRLQEVVTKGGLTGHQEYLLEELKLYAESIMPEEDA